MIKWEKGREVEEKGGRKREKERLGRSSTISQTSLAFCLPRPVHLCTKSDHVRTASEKLKKCWKNKKNANFEQNEHWFGALGSAISGTKHKGTTWDRQRSCKSGPTTAKKPPKMPQHLPHTVLTTVQHHQKSHKNMEKTTKSCTKSLKNQQKHGKNDNLMSKIDQQRVLCFRNLSARNVFVFT